MEAVRRQNDQHDKVWDQQRQVKAVGVVQSLEGRVGLFLQELHHRAGPWRYRKYGRKQCDQGGFRTTGFCRMRTIPGKLDCTRINLCHPSLFAQIVLIVIFLAASSALLAAQATASPQYPELARLGPSSYCNPFFGFRLALPAGLKTERIHFPVQPSGRHMLLALRLTRLDRTVEFFITAFEDSTKDPAALAAKVRVQQIRSGGLPATGPSKLSIHGHIFYRIHVIDDMRLSGDETSYYLNERGYVLRVAIFSHDHELSAAVESAVEHLKFAEPADAACAASPNEERTFYGPALPTELVESTIFAMPGTSIPPGEFSGRSFNAPPLGVRVELPPGWQPLPIEQAYRVTELMRDPTADPESTDRRRNLFRACSRTLFAASDPRQEITSEVHPGLAVVAMPKGCVPDLLPPTSVEDRDAAGEFATVMARTLGATLVSKWRIRTNAQGVVSSHLDGALPYRVPGEPLARRISLRVSAIANGNWIILIYFAAPSPAVEREIESRIHFTTPAAAPPK